jgi:hypothetical protein
MAMHRTRVDVIGLEFMGSPKKGEMDALASLRAGA